MHFYTIPLLQENSSPGLWLWRPKSSPGPGLFPPSLRQDQVSRDGSQWRDPPKPLGLGADHPSRAERPWQSQAERDGLFFLLGALPSDQPWQPWVLLQIGEGDRRRPIDLVLRWLNGLLRPHGQTSQLQISRWAFLVSHVYIFLLWLSLIITVIN